MILSLYVISVILFIISFKVTKLGDSFNQVLSMIKSTLLAIKNPELDDDEKEQIARKAAFKMLGAAISIILKSVVIIFISALPFISATFLDLSTWPEVESFLLRIDVLVYTTVLIILGWFIAKKLQRQKSK